jgi:type VI secretion system protein ImpE
MTAEGLLDEGRLAEAIASVEERVATRRDNPADRALLFELLGFAGELDRAEQQLEAIERLDPRPEARLGVRAYRGVIEAERARARLFDQGQFPQFFSEPTPAVGLHLEALGLWRAGRTAAARAVLDRASSLWRGRPGRAGGAAVDLVRDADDLLAPVLEVVTTEGYYWVPWEHVQFLLIPPPQYLRDLLWTPARLATDHGMLGEVYLPNLYFGSHRHPDEAVRLGRVTIWDDVGSGVIRGAGQKMVFAGDQPRTLLEIGEIQFAPASDEGTDPGRAPEQPLDPAASS